MRLLWSGTALDRLRLWTGLVLFAFVATHLLNHAVGLWSLEAMTTVQHWRLAVTRSPPGFVVLTASLLTHAGLALWKLARLRTLRLRRAEVLQGLSGLVIPYLLMNHLFEAGVGPRSLGVAAAYPAILPLLWPAKLSGQTLLIIVVWLHGCLGLHYWLRGEKGYRAASHVLAALAALIPAAALAGFVVAGREAARLAAADPTGRAAIELAAGLSAATRVAMDAHAADAKVAFYGLVALTVAILALRLFAVRRPAEFPVVYAGGRTVRSAVGPTLLEISRTNRVPHLSVCGGKARCSTCRVRIVERGEGLAPPAEAEQRLLRRIGAPPDVRLACQIRPNGPLMVALLLKPTAQFLTPSLASGFEAAGVDREAAVLFVDIRGFTRLSQAKLAYDVVHILNSFFAGVGQAIEAAGGRVDKYIGDGLMAVFEHPSGLPGAARAAVEAVVAIDDALGECQSPARGRNRRAAPARDGPARRPAGDRADRLGRGGAADGHRAGGQHREQAREPGEGEKRRTRRFARMRDRGRTFAGGARCRRGRHSRAGGAVPRPAGGRCRRAQAGKGRRGGVIDRLGGSKWGCSRNSGRSRETAHYFSWSRMRPLWIGPASRGHQRRRPERIQRTRDPASCPVSPTRRSDNEPGPASRTSPSTRRSHTHCERRVAMTIQMPHGLSRQPVRKIHHSRSRQTAMNSAVKPRLTPTPTSP